MIALCIYLYVAAAFLSLAAVSQTRPVFFHDSVISVFVPIVLPFFVIKQLLQKG